MEALLLKLWNNLLAVFLIPGKAMMSSLSGTAWGKELGVPADPEFFWVVICSLLFWCLFFSLIGAMNDRVRGFLNRNNRK